jgi:hypothetical protein
VVLSKLVLLSTVLAFSISFEMLWWWFVLCRKRRGGDIFEDFKIIRLVTMRPTIFWLVRQRERRNACHTRKVITESPSEKVIHEMLDR